MWGDIGSELTIQGLIVGGQDAQALLFLPGFKWREDATVHILTDAEWSDFIHRSDDPEVLIGNTKVFQRKIRFQISGAIQQRVWAADGFRCVYCHAGMGTVLMTIDHFVPIELGGMNNETNFVTACRSCNKDKGNEDARTWCNRRGHNHDAILSYLNTRQL